MTNVTCPACGYNAQSGDEIINHMKGMMDDKHKGALKQKMGAKGGEVTDTAKDKASDIASEVKNKI